MLRKRAIESLRIGIENRIVVFDLDDLDGIVGLRNLFKEAGYTIYEYRDIELFRIAYEEIIRPSEATVAVLVNGDLYVPYDIRCAFHCVSLSVTTLFPKLNAEVVIEHKQDWDIISFAYEDNYSDLTLASLTTDFLRERVFSAANVDRYCCEKCKALSAHCDFAENFLDWIEIAKAKASVEYYATMASTNMELSFVDQAFRRFIDEGYSRLSSEVGDESPSIVTKILSFVASDTSRKTALIVMDGMSLFDFEVMSRQWTDFQFTYGASYALIPTTTPISRQSLLSGKYPRELTRPFSLVNEEKEFFTKAIDLGYAKERVEYLRGLEVEIDSLSTLIVIVINDIDDIVHGQQQGRVGMFNDVDLLARSGKLQSLIKHIVSAGFSVYITADHGNTPCVGVGSFRSGVETESRSKRMAILKNFAIANTLLSENTTEYSGYYLDKDYRYFVCKTGVSFDNKGKQVMTHGGMSIDEVIVPFVRIEELD